MCSNIYNINDPIIKNTKNKIIKELISTKWGTNDNKPLKIEYFSIKQFQFYIEIQEQKLISFSVISSKQLLLFIEVKEEFRYDGYCRNMVNFLMDKGVRYVACNNSNNEPYNMWKIKFNLFIIPTHLLNKCISLCKEELKNDYEKTMKILLMTVYSSMLIGIIEINIDEVKVNEIFFITLKDHIKNGLKMVK